MTRSSWKRPADTAQTICPARFRKPLLPSPGGGKNVVCLLRNLWFNRIGPEQGAGI